MLRAEKRTASSRSKVDHGRTRFKADGKCVCAVGHLADEVQEMNQWTTKAISNGSKAANESALRPLVRVTRHRGAARRSGRPGPEGRGFGREPEPRPGGGGG